MFGKLHLAAAARVLTLADSGPPSAKPPSAAVRLAVAVLLRETSERPPS